MDDASLDDFLGDGDGDDDGDESTVATGATDEETADADGPESETAADAGTADRDDDSPHVDPDSVDPAVSTYAWSDDESACAACGESVRVRWQDEAGLVCAACKEW